MLAFLLGEAIQGRMKDLKFPKSIWEDYNTLHKAAFEINDGVTGEMFKDITGNSAKAIDHLKAFADEPVEKPVGKDGIADHANRINREYLAKDFKQSRKDAQVLVNGHDVLSGKYTGSVYRLFTQMPKESWPGLAAMLAAHGMGLPFPLPQMLGATLAARSIASEGATSAGEVGTRLRQEMPPETFRSRTQIPEQERPFYPTPRSKSPSPPSTAPTEPPSKAVAMRAAHAKSLRRQAPTKGGSTEPKSTLLQRIQEANRGPVEESDVEQILRGAPEAQPSVKTKPSGLSLEDWNKIRQAEEIQQRRGARKARQEKGSR